MEHRVASISLDLDNQWSYMKTHGDDGWQTYPSYLDTVVPRLLHFFKERDTHITVFIVGQDAALTKNHRAIASIAAEGHEIGNHSFRHDPWLHLFSELRLEEEVASTEYWLERVTGKLPRGFRGPGFSRSETLLRVLTRRGYRYDASSFPTFLGPVARAYFFLTARLDREQREERKKLFGKLVDGFRPLRPHELQSDEGCLLEIPVTTMPILKLPIHLSYLLFLRQFSRSMAVHYFRAAMRLCRWNRVQPSLLFHPLDFIGYDDLPEFAYFPGMKLTRDTKLAFVGEIVDVLCREFTPVTLIEHARRAAEGYQSGETKVPNLAGWPWTAKVPSSTG